MSIKLRACCECGFETYNKVGREPSGDEYDVAVCFNCGTMVSKIFDGPGIDDEDYRCPNCWKELVFIKTNRFFSTVGPKERTELVGVRNYSPCFGVRRVRYLCPSCGRKRMVFETIDEVRTV